MQYQLKNIRLEDIDVKDDTFLHRYKINSKGFTGSCVVPIVLTCEKPYRVISGFRRLKFVQENQSSETIKALLVTAPSEDKELFLLSLLWNQGTSFSDLDYANLVTKAKNRFGIPEEELLDLLSRFSGQEWYGRKLHLFEKLWLFDDSLKAFFYAHNFGLKVAENILSFSEEDKRYLVDFVLKAVYFTASEFKKFTSLLKDLMSMRRLSLEELLLPYREFIAQEPSECSPKEKARCLIQELAALRYPTITKLSQNIKDFQKKIPTDSKVVFSVPDAFEQDHFELKLKFQKKEDLEKNLREIEKNLDVFDDVERVLDVE